MHSNFFVLRSLKTIMKILLKINIIYFSRNYFNYEINSINDNSSIKKKFFFLKKKIFIFPKKKNLHFRFIFAFKINFFRTTNICTNENDSLEYKQFRSTQNIFISISNPMQLTCTHWPRLYRGRKSFNGCSFPIDNSNPLFANATFFLSLLFCPDKTTITIFIWTFQSWWRCNRWNCRSVKRFHPTWIISLCLFRNCT